MRNLLAFVAAAVLAFLAVGWYLGWYQVVTRPNLTTGHEAINIDVDGNKIGDDIHKAEAKIVDAAEKARQDHAALAADEVKTAGDKLLPGKEEKKSGFRH